MSKVSNITNALNGINVQLSSNKIELGIVDDLDKLFEQSDVLIPEFKKISGWIDLTTKQINTRQKEVDKIAPVVSKLESEYSKRMKELEQTKDALNAQNKVLDSARASINDSEKNIASYQKQIDPIKKKISTYAISIDKKIQEAEKASKALGVDLPLSKYQKLLENLRKV